MGKATETTVDTEVEATAKTEQETFDQDAYLHELVEIQLFKDNRRYKDDVKVFVNGKNWVIQRGVPVKVPRYVANVIYRSQKQDMASDAMITSLAQRYEERTKSEANES